ncbi:anthrax toxin lethal factor-related metalloendopeptidase [Aquibacillus rhizosphaerae]|uniref:Toxin n=1 Tax=Aquibacillus rhizosphaerae TaxID=3051431 RepID=A0ABT7L1K4_9BACI|nr:toxin [Aquibacillus sp. LR5S19]MDL4839727.1 toxin [Aquibacillus sp. LR5S19]
MKIWLKRIRVMVIILFFSFLPYVEITRPFNGIMLQHAKGNQDLLQLQSLKNADLLYKLIIIPEKLTDTKSLSNMVNRINRIDRALLEMLVDQGVKVRLFEGKLTDEPLLYYLKWDQPRGWKRETTWENVPGSGGSWLVSAKIGASMPGKGHSSINLELHEIGHTVYHVLMNDPSYATKIQHAWNKEVEFMFSGQDYFVNYPSEYFAEMFAYYYKNKRTNAIIKLKAPVTYELFNEFSSITFTNFDQIYLD